MKKKLLLSILMTLFLVLGTFAQRPMDKLDRGLVAIKVNNGVYCSWRIPGEEWYDVTYNLYRDGAKVNSTPLNVSNYTDTSGSLTSTYTVKAMVRGVEQTACNSVSVWGQQYLSIPMSNVYIPMVGSNQKKSNNLFELNDASVADLDGDGQYEIIVKRINEDFSVANDSAFTRFEAYKMDGTKLWQIDCGPNMVSGSNVEVNCVAYDWDCDGKAEVVLRCADGTILNDGTRIGTTSNYRSYITQSPNLTYMTQGPEYLLLIEGATGKLLDNISYPLPRGNASDWGDETGHRCNKFFFGAPFLDGRKPSLVLARGIYSKTIMCALDIVNKKFQSRWSNTTDFVTPGSPWFGQGYHNFGIADVDNDGKDEIVYGSMVVDDNGKGLYTTGLGHGDAQHCGDFDPYRKGLEIFACNEANPGANYRDAATGKILWRYTASSDCGRCMAANVSNDFDGAVLIAGPHFHSATDNEDKTWVNSVTQNFELYWDGDLLQETMDYTSSKDVTTYGAGTPAIFKCNGSTSPVFTMSGSYTNNYTKGTPCMQCDILGDWREEEIVRSSDNMSLRIYTTTAPTTNRIYTLLHDMQYRNAIEWQMCGYNQPPHESFFLGEREGILVPPPPVMTNDRKEETTSITSTDDDQHVLLCNMTGGTVTVSDGVKPYIVTVNSPKDYTLTGAAFTNNMRLVKQGCGKLTFNGNQTYSGETNLWDGITTFSGTIEKSPVWMNRFAEMNLTGSIKRSVVEEYGAILHVAGDQVYGKASVDTLTLKRGAIIKMDLKSDGTSFNNNDTINIGKLTLKGGCVFEFIQHNSASATKPAAGDYYLGTYAAIDSTVSDSIYVEGLGGTAATISFKDGKIYVHVPSTRGNTTITWDGSESTTWDIAKSENFVVDGSKDKFIGGDDVIFDDNATSTSVVITGGVSPKSITFNNDTKTFTLSGDSIIGGTGLTKNGDGTLHIKNANNYTGNTVINAGKVFVASMSNKEGVDNGSLGHVGNKLYINGGATLGFASSLTIGNSIIAGEGGATLNVGSGSTVLMKGSVFGSNTEDLIKDGAGQLSIYSGNTIKRLVIKAGTVYDAANGHSCGDTIVFNGTSGTMSYMNSTGTNSAEVDPVNISIPYGKTGTLWVDGRCTMTGKLVGEGTLNLYIQWVRNYLQGNWSAFRGTVNAYQQKTATYDPDFQLNNSYGLPNATLNVMSGTTINNMGNAFSIGVLGGTGTLTGTGTYTIGTKGTNFSFNTVINGSNLVKSGSSMWTIGSTQSLTDIGTLTVNQGILYLNNQSATTTMTGSNTMTISGTGELSGNGYCGNPTVYIRTGATLHPGSPTSLCPTGSISFSGTVNANTGSNVEFSMLNAKNYVSSHSFLKVGGTLIINGNINLNWYRSESTTYVPASGDSIILWTANAFSGTPVLNLPELPDGLSWDTSDLLKPTGILRITSTNGVSSISDNETVRCNVYTISGTKVSDFICTMNEVDNQISNSPLIAGTYILKIKGTRTSTTRKFIIK